MPDETAAADKFAYLVDEARRWRGSPARVEETSARRLASWPDLEIRQAGRGLIVRVRAPRFADWWHDTRIWENDPMAAVFTWLADDRESK
jgi:hypothetical protein